MLFEPLVPCPDCIDCCWWLSWLSCVCCLSLTGWLFCAWRLLSYYSNVSLALLGCFCIFNYPWVATASFWGTWRELAAFVCFELLFWFYAMACCLRDDAKWRKLCLDSMELLCSSVEEEESWTTWNVAIPDGTWLYWICELLTWIPLDESSFTECLLLGVFWWIDLTLEKGGVMSLLSLMSKVSCREIFDIDWLSSSLLLFCALRFLIGFLNRLTLLASCWWP